jgi:hypothetical protein
MPGGWDNGGNNGNGNGNPWPGSNRINNNDNGNNGGGFTWDDAGQTAPPGSVQDGAGGGAGGNAVPGGPETRWHDPTAAQSTFGAAGTW